MYGYASQIPTAATTIIVKLHKQARTTPAIRQEIGHPTGSLA